MKKSERLKLTQIFVSSMTDLCNHHANVMKTLGVSREKFRKITVDAIAGTTLNILMTLVICDKRTQAEAWDMLFETLNEKELSNRIDKMELVDEQFSSLDHFLNKIKKHLEADK